MRIAILFIALLINFTLRAQQIKDTTVFPINTTYMYFPDSNVYPLAKATNTIISTMDTANFVNIMNVGGHGDGVTLDDAAIIAAFTAANTAGTGVKFPSGRTFLFSKLNVINMTKSVGIYAVGATFKMKDLTKYSFLDLDYPLVGNSGYQQSNVIWIGGTMDGNQVHQSYPNSPTGDSTWEEAHGQMIEAKRLAFALFKDIHLRNIVTDGINVFESKIVCYSDCDASGGVLFNFEDVGLQGTYFKIRHEYTVAHGTALYVNHINCTDGSIGIQYSTTTNHDPVPGAMSVINNCFFYNQAMDAMHFEHDQKVFVYRTFIGCDTVPDLVYGHANLYHDRIHIANNTETVSIMSCTFRNGRIDFRNAAGLKLGMIDSSIFSSTNKNIVNGIDQYIDGGGATLLQHSTFTGFTRKFGASVRNVKKCTFTNFTGDTAVYNGFAIDSVNFINGLRPATLRSGGFITPACTYTNVTIQQTRSQPSTSTWKDVFSSFIRVVDQNNTFIGTIPATPNVIVRRYYRDQDGDTYGNISIHKDTTFKPIGYVLDSLDCNDANSNINPSVTEICANGVDDNCNGQTDECTRYYRDADLDGYGNILVFKDSVARPIGYIANNLDCNDADANVHPGTLEKCNGIDDNCNGTIDEGCVRYFIDQDGDSYGNSQIFKDSTTQPTGYVIDSTDCDDNNVNIHPNTIEVCSNGVDDNCNGQIDENCGTIVRYYKDLDGDGYGDPNINKDSIGIPIGYVINNEDCNDANANINPDAIELCDSIDNNCNGNIDEGCSAIKVGFRSSTYTASEGKQVKLTVGISAISSNAVTVRVSTSNGTATTADYNPITNQLITIPAGRTSRVFCIRVIADAISEPSETFNVTLSSPVNASLSINTATVTIN